MVDAFTYIDYFNVKHTLFTCIDDFQTVNQQKCENGEYAALCYCSAVFMYRMVYSKHRE